ncbi:MAG TPA: GTP-binding protein, partial [bacterium]|nr:GTP-binding protein [bacterium]
METTPVSNRLQIGIFGRRNAGKSSFINAITGQNTAIVSEVPGTTTDPVGKAMEIKGPGPVYIYDTAGLDDTGELGIKRVNRSMEIIRRINLAIIVTTYSQFDEFEAGLISRLKENNVDIILVFNKTDVDAKDEEKEQVAEKLGIKHISLSCAPGQNIEKARELIARVGQNITVEPGHIISDIVENKGAVVLVVPIDTGAPKGRIILPQVQVIRDCLDHDLA